MGWFNFEEQLVFYGSYHNHPWNRAIHIVFVPLIFWSILVWLAKLPILILLERFPFNVSFACTFMYIFYYLLLEPVAGVSATNLAVYAPFLLTITYSANVFALKYPKAWEVSVAAHVIGWFFQILGHVVFEKRSPAFLDNILQAFLTAPLFIFMELLFLVGYRPALQRRTREKIKVNIQTWKLGRDQRHIKPE